eukprot:TRINITY_DN5019_c0_g1_i1.p2 TRINITY_DN5019_c0_g1~~TRINITY_DN5019_c0_g1_i1.p2  ORF type:complete len:103 (+),score=1.66 TRINITY_DN5019_c0_g1_i1:107-415(+)
MSQQLRTKLFSAVGRGTFSPSAKAATSRRTFASAAGHDDLHEMEKWRKITYAGIIVCTALSIYHLALGHGEHGEIPPYPYRTVHYKDYPWGPDGLFTKKQHH